VIVKKLKTDGTWRVLKRPRISRVPDGWQMLFSRYLTTDGERLTVSVGPVVDGFMESKWKITKIEPHEMGIVCIKLIGLTWGECCNYAFLPLPITILNKELKR